MSRKTYCSLQLLHSLSLTRSTMATRRQRTTLRASHAAPGPSTSLDGAARREALFADPNIWATMDRAQVLGTGHRVHGHIGCVNALSWAADGSSLLTGSDDKRLCIWTPDPAPAGSEPSPHPLKLADTILTGHRANIFSAHFLSELSTPTAISCAGDDVIGVYEVERLGRVEGGRNDGELDGRGGPGTRKLRCHTARVKKLLPSQLSPSVFLSVSEDSTIRQHDLRESHSCLAGDCPEPLWRGPGGMELYTLSTQAEGSGSGAGWAMVAGGRDECAFVLDRRMLKQQEQDWGKRTTSKFQKDAQVQCVRRLGVLPKARSDAASSHGSQADEDDLYHESNPEMHVTSVRMSRHVSHEVLVNFSNHSTSLFSIFDTPMDRGMRSPSPGVLPPNARSRTPSDGGSPRKRAKKAQAAMGEPHVERLEPAAPSRADDPLDDPRIQAILGRMPREEYTADELAELGQEEESDDEVSMGSFEDNEGWTTDDDDDNVELDYDTRMRDYVSPSRTGERDDSVPIDLYDNVDFILPRRSFFGARNYETVKDCNFLGARSDKVVSGSDDGNFFVWDKDTGKLEGIWEGDGSVVNVVEQHPTLPLLAVSGIDSTIKIFTPLQPAPDPSFSRMSQAETIIARNSHPSGLQRNRLRIDRAAIMQLLARHRDGAELAEGEPDPGQCTTQ